jgi:biopolymer transport protein ExbB/TolQ
MRSHRRPLRQALAGITALIAADPGLFIATMALVPYNDFRTQMEQLIDHMEVQASRLEFLSRKRQEHVRVCHDIAAQGTD